MKKKGLIEKKNMPYEIGMQASVPEMNWIMLYMQMNLMTPKEVTRAERPSRITRGTHSMLGLLEVKGEATEASAFESEMPAFAALSAPQSFAPSPHMPTK